LEITKFWQLVEAARAAEPPDARAEAAAVTGARPS
jgi:hypothetical protein